MLPVSRPIGAGNLTPGDIIRLGQCKERAVEFFDLLIYVG
jgi:hypothetical protein